MFRYGEKVSTAVRSLAERSLPVRDDGHTLDNSLGGGIEDDEETLAVGSDIEFVQAVYLKIRGKQFSGSLGPNTLRPALNGDSHHFSAGSFIIDFLVATPFHVVCSVGGKLPPIIALNSCWRILSKNAGHSVQSQEHMERARPATQIFKDELEN